MDIDQLFKTLGNIGTNLFYVGSNLGHFGAALENGPGALSLFNDAVSNLSTAVLEYATKAFKEAAQMETERIGAGGAISAGFDQKVSFEQGLELYDQARVKIAGIAAAYPGITSEYTKTLTLISDDIGSALNDGNKSGAQLAEQFSTWGPEIVKNLVLNSKLYGQDIPISAVTRSFSKLLNTGKITSKEIFIQRNPLLLASIEKYEKENKKLAQMSKFERLQALNTIFAKTFSKEQLSKLTSSFSSKVETAKSFLFDPDVGLLGFNRKFKDTKGEDTTIFKVLADSAAPFIDALGESAKLLTKFADPLQASAKLIKDKVEPALQELAASLNRGVFAAVMTKGTFQEKLEAGLSSALGVDVGTYDFAAAITRFFDNIASTIDNFGKPGKKIGATMLDKSIDALINGLFKVIGSFMNKIIERFLADPVGTLKVAFILNPSATIQFGMLFLSLIPLLVSVIQLFAMLVPALQMLGSAILSVLASPIGIALAVTALLTAVAMLSDEIKFAADYFANFGGYFSATLTWLSVGLRFLGEAGEALKRSFNALVSGDWSTFGDQLAMGVGGLLYGIGTIGITIVAGLAQAIAYVSGAISNIVRDFGSRIYNAGGPSLKLIGLIFTNIGEAFGGLEKVLNGIVSLDFGLAFEGLLQLIGNLILSLGTFIAAIPILAIELIAGIADFIGNQISNFGLSLANAGGPFGSTLKWLGATLNAFGDALSGINLIVRGVFNANINQLAEGIISLLTGIVVSVISAAITVIGGVLEGTKNILNGFGYYVGQAGQAIIGIGGPFKQTFEWLGATAASFGDSLTAGGRIIEGILELSFEKFATGVIDLVGYFAVGLISGAVAIAMAFVNIVTIITKGLGTAIKDVGTWLMDNAMGPFKGTLMWLGSALTSLGDALKSFADAVNYVLQGNWISAFDALINGLKNTLASAGALILGTATGVFEAFKGIGDSILRSLNLKDGFDKFFSDLGSSFKSLVIDPLQKALDSILQLVPGYKPSVGTISPNATTSLSNAADAFEKLLPAGLKPPTNFRGNAFGNILGALAQESLNMPSGATAVVANSSEAIVPRPQAQGILSVLSNAVNSSNKTATVIVNNYGNEDITQKVIYALESILA